MQSKKGRQCGGWAPKHVCKLAPDRERKLSLCSSSLSIGQIAPNGQLACIGARTTHDVVTQAAMAQLAEPVMNPSSRCFKGRSAIG